MFVCPHRHRGRWAHDPQTGQDYEPCLDCGRRLPLSIQFPRRLALPAPRFTGLTGIDRAWLKEQGVKEE